MGRMILSHDPKTFRSGEEDQDHQRGKKSKPKIGRRRQVVGILVKRHFLRLFMVLVDNGGEI